MKKTWKSFIAAGILSLSVTVSSFAGSWQTGASGYWYQNDDGTYPVNCWQWIDGNGDGIAESYYFNDKGYILTDTTTPDGYTVDSNGAWTVNGIVQTQTVSAPSAQTQPPKQETQPPKQETQSSPQGTTSPSEKTKTQETRTQTTGSSASAKSAAGISSVPYDGYTIIANTSTKKYHRPGCASVSKMKDSNKGYASDASYLESRGYVPCKNCH